MFKTLSVNKTLSSLFSLIQKSIYIMQLVNHTCVYEWGMRKKITALPNEQCMYTKKFTNYSDYSEHLIQEKITPPVIETSEDENPRVNPIDPAYILNLF